MADAITLPEITLPGSYNYIAVFLTLHCNLNCSYCINKFDQLSTGRTNLTGEEWLSGLNRLVSRSDLPLTFQGGEPTLHPEFYHIVNGIRTDLAMDLLTNLEFDSRQFMKSISPEKFKRDAPYASIRVSYHPEVMKIEKLAAKVMDFLDRGYHMGIWGVKHPLWVEEISRAQDYCLQRGIDFRTKEYLGDYDGILHGVIRYPGACDRKSARAVVCRTSELIIGPDGHIYRCHGDLYAGRSAIGHLLAPDFRIDDQFRSCSWFGYCNPCDVKVKTNRHQEYGHTSVIIHST
jgi:hypothetical protein